MRRDVAQHAVVVGTGCRGLRAGASIAVIDRCGFGRGAGCRQKPRAPRPAHADDRLAHGPVAEPGGFDRLSLLRSGTGTGSFDRLSHLRSGTGLRGFDGLSLLRSGTGPGGFNGLSLLRRSGGP